MQRRLELLRECNGEPVGEAERELTLRERPLVPTPASDTELAAEVAVANDELPAGHFAGAPGAAAAAEGVVPLIIVDT